MPNAKQQSILFLTGKLAKRQLESVLETMQIADFRYEVRNIGISVAALMTTSMISRRLSGLEGIDQVIIPGLCQGDLEALSKALGIPCIRGPIDLKELPVFFNHDCKPPDLSRYHVQIFAEIVDAPTLSIDAILDRAACYQYDGANVIDLGCLPGTAFPHLEDSIQALHDVGLKVSVDSAEEDELVRAGKAGADYLLSLRESTLWIAEQFPITPILIAEQPQDLPSLYRAIEHCLKKGQAFIADPILDPIHFGLTRSIVRYHSVRQDFPNIPIMMGTGNVTELTEADTTGMNALLFGLISEMGLDAVLTTEVSPHCCSVIREADRARRIMYAAKQGHGLPKGLDDSLTALHARRPLLYSEEEIQEYYQAVRDPSYRIQISPAGIHVYNRDGIHLGQDPFSLFPQLSRLQDDASHAFYMGVELAKAQIAWQLGKPYRQDQILDWGAAALDPKEAVAKNQGQKIGRADGDPPIKPKKNTTCHAGPHS